MYVYDTTFKHGQMAAILFMQIRWLLLIYELFEPLAALELFSSFTDDVFTLYVQPKHFTNHKSIIPITLKK